MNGRYWTSKLRKRIQKVVFKNVLSLHWHLYFLAARIGYRMLTLQQNLVLLEYIHVLVILISIHLYIRIVGGGAWRVRWRVLGDGNSDELLVACMQGGAKIFRVDNDTSGQVSGGTCLWQVTFSSRIADLGKRQRRKRL